MSNPRIYGYCDDPGAETARKCAVNKCIEKGGKNCTPWCNSNTGKRLRACRLGVNTYIASSTYGRFGCGTRWVTGCVYSGWVCLKRAKKV